MNTLIPNTQYDDSNLHDLLDMVKSEGSRALMNEMSFIMKDHHSLPLSNQTLEARLIKQRVSPHVMPNLLVFDLGISIFSNCKQHISVVFVITT